MLCRNEIQRSLYLSENQITIPTAAELLLPPLFMLTVSQHLYRLQLLVFAADVCNCLAHLENMPLPLPQINHKCIKSIKLSNYLSHTSDLPVSWLPHPLQVLVPTPALALSWRGWGEPSSLPPASRSSHLSQGML